jgi:purine-cytosine permease-like protein
VTLIPSKQLKIGRWSVSMPASRPVRILLGVALVIGGLLGFLPVLGFWMVPLGVIVLSADLPAVRRFRRRVELWWGYRKRRRAAAVKDLG